MNAETTPLQWSFIFGLQVQPSSAQLRPYLCDMEPDADDLPLRANTNHILVRHYVLDLAVHFDRKVIGGTVVLFLEPCSGSGSAKEEAGGSPGALECRSRDAGEQEDATIGLAETPTRAKNRCAGRERDAPEPRAPPGSGSAHAAAESGGSPSPRSWEANSGGDFTLLLDCCDLDVSKVEEVDVASASAAPGLLPHPVAPEGSAVPSVKPEAAFVQNLLSVPAGQWRRRQQLLSLCSRAPGAPGGGSLPFRTDRWSLQVRKKGAVSPRDFPRVLRICYETRPEGGSVRWTQDQDNRFVSACKSFTVSFGFTLLDFSSKYFRTVLISATRMTV